MWAEVRQGRIGAFEFLTGIGKDGITSQAPWVRIQHRIKPDNLARWARRYLGRTVDPLLELAVFLLVQTIQIH